MRRADGEVIPKQFCSLQRETCEFIGSVALELLYADLECQDFSRDVLERHAQMLQVLRVPSCGWTDLGTPKRVQETIRQSRAGAITGNHDAFRDWSTLL
jgi:hypothetical protein